MPSSCRRAPARRRLAEPSLVQPEVQCRLPLPPHLVALLAVALLVACSCGDVPPAPAPSSLGTPRSHRLRPPPCADQAGRRARLHPERPVRPVLPRPAERATTRTRASRSSSRTRSIRTSSRWSARAPSTSGSATGRASSRRSARASRSSTSRRSTGIPAHRLRQGVVGHHRGGRPQGQEDRHPGPLRLVAGSCSRRCWSRPA